MLATRLTATLLTAPPPPTLRCPAATPCLPGNFFIVGQIELAAEALTLGAKNGVPGERW